MFFRYELTSRSGPGPTWRVTGPGLHVHGVERRGYLTLPPLEISDTGGAVAALLGGNRRVAPTRHMLTSPNGGVLATFDTRLIARVVDKRHTKVTDAEGGELCTFVPVEAYVDGWRDTLLAAIDGGYLLTRGGSTIGRLGNGRDQAVQGGLAGRTGDLARQAVRRIRGHASEHVAGVLECEIQFDPLSAAALLLYKRFVLDPSRLPES